MLTNYDNRRIDSASIAQPSDPRLLAYAKRCGQTVEQLVRDGVRIVECTCRMSGCPGWEARWPTE